MVNRYFVISVLMGVIGMVVSGCGAAGSGTGATPPPAIEFVFTWFDFNGDGRIDGWRSLDLKGAGQAGFWEGIDEGGKLNPTQWGGWIPYQNLGDWGRYFDWQNSMKGREPPEVKCTEPSRLDCSGKLEVREVVLTLPNLAYYNNVFDAACATHDLCYHHGFITYGMSRASCDDDFYLTMVSICDGWSDQDSGDADTAGNTKEACYEYALVYYQVVKYFGEVAFHQMNGTYCEYMGSPEEMRK